MVARKGYKLTEIGEIPEDWEVKPMNYAIKGSPSYGINAPAVPYEYSLPVYIRITDISEDGRFLVQNRVSVSHLNSSKYFLKKGDIVFARTGASVGKTYLHQSDEENVVFAGFLIRISPDRDKIVPYFLWSHSKTAYYARWIIEQSMRSGQPGVNSKQYAELPISFPPNKEEQTAIATALSDADALIDALEQCIAKKRHIKQGAMQELLTGKRRLPGYEGEWKAIPFGELATPSCSRFTTSSAQQTNFCIELEHIGQGTGLLLGYTHATKLSSLKSCFEEGDVLFGKLRAYLRKYWRATRSGVCSTEIWVLKSATEKVISEYVYQVVQTDSFIETASTAYGTHMPRSDWRIVKNLEIQLPPTLNEQTAIAAVLTAMDDEIAALEAKLSKARQIKAGMMQELLTGRTRLV